MRGKRGRREERLTMRTFFVFHILFFNFSSMGIHTNFVIFWGITQLGLSQSIHTIVWFSGGMHANVP